MTRLPPETSGELADVHGQLSAISPPDLTRRTTLKGAALIATGPLLGHAQSAVSQGSSNVAPSPAVSGEYVVSLRTRVNGRAVLLPVDARTSLLDLCRESLDLTGAKGPSGNSRIGWDFSP